MLLISEADRSVFVCVGLKYDGKSSSGWGTTDGEGGGGARKEVPELIRFDFTLFVISRRRMRERATGWTRMETQSRQTELSMMSTKGEASSCQPVDSRSSSLFVCVLFPFHLYNHSRLLCTTKEMHFTSFLLLSVWSIYRSGAELLISFWMYFNCCCRCSFPLCNVLWIKYLAHYFVHFERLIFCGKDQPPSSAPRRCKSNSHI